MPDDEEEGLDQRHLVLKDTSKAAVTRKAQSQMPKPSYSKHPRQSLLFHSVSVKKRSPQKINHDLSSRSTHSFLKIVRKFARIFKEVEFRVPRDGETAENPPDGYFTCYEAFRLRCRLWFPNPEIIDRVLESFKNINRSAEPRWLGAPHRFGDPYEHSLTLTVDHFEAFLRLQNVLGSMFRPTPRTNMSVIKKTTPHPSRKDVFRCFNDRPFISPLHPF
uniref:Uncharacterized protein n=1 Tax=Brassica campestris TaxID=3711 RepID=M4FII2_BRACM